MFWGLTPALDLLNEPEIKSHGVEDFNILLIGGADCRHVLKTIARRYRHPKVNLNFYIMEACPETIAKQLLLLFIALQPTQELGLIQKARYFMELYGNSLIRPAVAKYLTTCAAEFINMITDLEYMKEKMPWVNLDLKYKERDYIENLFKFWCSLDTFDICECWDRRLRKYLGVRYDSKKGAFDWDLQMRFHCIGGAQVGNQEYQSFRTNGVAFSWLESEVSKTNRSMVCGIIANGENFAHYGYLGEMETGPFVAYGLDCEDKEFLKSSNNVKKHRATDVTERNLKQIFFEIENQTEYTDKKMNDLNLGSVVIQFNTIKVIDTGAENDNKKKNLKKCIHMDGVTINFVSLGKLAMMKHKEQFRHFFDLIYFNSTYLKKYFERGTVGVIGKPGSLLIIENQTFVLNYREKELSEYGKVISDKLGELSRTDLPFDVQKDCYAKVMLK